MKRFIVKTILISLPIILLGIFVELIITYYPNTFNRKADYLNSNLQISKILFLGSSHTQNSINPRFIDIPSLNLAYAGQDYQLDSALFFKHINQLGTMKKVFIEMDYHSLEEKNTDDYFRLAWYYKYYDINLGKFKFKDKISLYFTNTSFFTKYLINVLNPWREKMIINKYGFIENDTGIFEELDFDEKNILQSANSRLKNKHNRESEANFKFNKSKILSVIDYCLKNEIEVTILKNPVYITYRNNYVQAKSDRRSFFIDSLVETGKVQIMDFESDDRFKVADFKDDDHLNSAGAKKLSSLINNKISNRK